MADKIRLIAYGRVSTDSESQLNSFYNQKEYFDKKYADHPDYEYMGFVGDEGKSGTNLVGRPVLINLLERAGLEITYKKNKRYNIDPVEGKEPEFDMICCKDVSRFGRSVKLLEVLDVLRSKNVVVKFEQNDIRTDTMAGGMMLGMLMSIAQQESIDKSAKVIFGLNGSKEDGIINNTRYGYTKVGKRADAKLIINEEEAKVIKLLFELYAKGLGIRRIIQEFARLGIVTDKGKPFAPSTLKKFLEQPLYKGQFVRNRYSKGSLAEGNQQTYSKVKPEAEWKKFEGVAPEIVSPELWDKVQVIRQGKINHQTRKGKKVETSTYSGLLYCGKCGQPYLSNKHKNGRGFYICKDKKQKGVSVCNWRNVQEYEIENKIDELCSGGFYQSYVLRRDSLIRDLETKKQEVIARGQMEVDHERVKAIESEIEAVESEQMVYIRQLGKGQISESMFEKLNQPLIETRATLIEELRLLNQTDEEIQAEIKQFEEEIDNIRFIEVGEAISKDELMKHISRFNVRMNGLEVVFKADSLIGGTILIAPPVEVGEGRQLIMV